MKKTIWWMACGLVAGLSAARAQDMPELVAQAMAQAQVALADVDDESLAFAAGELNQERLVKSAPYCATAVHESVQWLVDAAGGPPNRIVRRQTSRLCRDAEGRTRQEVERQGRPLVYLRDPVAGESWVLDPQRKTARRLLRVTATVRHEGLPDSAAWRDYAERMRQWAGEMARQWKPPHPPAPPAPPGNSGMVAPPAPPAPPTPVVVQRFGPDGDPPGDVRGTTRVHVLRLGDGAPGGSAAAGWPLPPPTVAQRLPALAPRGPAVVTPLPAREIDGLRANGERSTWTIEAGRIGNERPIQIVREVWTSPDLVLTLSVRDVDPRSGEVNYRLEQVRRGDPDPASMRVPADYQASPRPRG